jgi:hypothetical protein
MHFNLPGTPQAGQREGPALFMVAIVLKCGVMGPEVELWNGRKQKNIKGKQWARFYSEQSYNSLH